MELTRQSQLRRQSLRRARSGRERDRARRKFVASYLARYPTCEANLVKVCAGRAVHVHERKTRSRGGSIVDQQNCLALCASCHRWTHAHQDEAHELGLLVHSWEHICPTCDTAYANPAGDGQCPHCCDLLDGV